MNRVNCEKRDLDLMRKRKTNDNENQCTARTASKTVEIFRRPTRWDNGESMVRFR